MNLKELLESTGMGSYKAEAYLGLLKIGQGSIQQIARNCKVPSCKLYECMKWLHGNGYVTLISDSPLRYRANDPKEAVLGDVSEEMQRLEKIREQAKIVDLDIQPLEKGVIQLTTTRKGYFEKTKECAWRAEKYLHYMLKSWKYDAELLSLFREKVKNGVELRALGPVNKKTRRVVNMMRKIGVQVRHYEPKGIRFNVFDDKIVIISLRREEEEQTIKRGKSAKEAAEYPAAYIESDVLAEILESRFQELWKQAK